jgi:hypothetical protein
MPETAASDSVAPLEKERPSLTLVAQLLLSNFWFALQFLCAPIGVVIVPDDYFEVLLHVGMSKITFHSRRLLLTIPLILWDKVSSILRILPERLL